MSETFASVDEYIASFPDSVGEVLEEIRDRVKKVVPESGEKISYQIPTCTIDGKYFMYFAGFANHVSVYPVHTIEGMDAEMAPYRSGKATLRFPLDEPVPFDLIERVARALAKQQSDGESTAS